MISHQGIFSMALLTASYFSSSPDLEVLYRSKSETPRSFTIPKKTMDLTLSLEYWNYRADHKINFVELLWWFLTASVMYLSLCDFNRTWYIFSFSSIFIRRREQIFPLNNKSNYDLWQYPQSSQWQIQGGWQGWLGNHPPPSTPPTPPKMMGKNYNLFGGRNLFA